MEVDSRRGPRRQAAAEAWRYLGIACRIDGHPDRARLGLVRRAEHHVDLRNRVGTVSLDQGVERLGAVAIQRARIVHLGHDVAIVFDTPAGAETSLEEQTVARPGVQTDVTAIPVVPL